MLVRMAIHTDFWVVAGTASPVVVLSAIVATTDALSVKLWSKPKRIEKSRQRIPLLAYFISTFTAGIQSTAFSLRFTSQPSPRGAMSAYGELVLETLLRALPSWARLVVLLISIFSVYVY
jgi:hypothetical protein